MSSELLLISLPNGAELIGRVIKITDEAIVLEHPLVIRPIQRGPNDMALDLFPHSLASPDGEHAFTRRQILSEAMSIPAPLEKAYLERTSGIILSTQMDKLEGRM